MTERRGGRGKCAVCHSPREQEINVDLAPPSPHYRVLAKRYEISVNALRNHKAMHLSPALVTLAKAREQVGAPRVLDDIYAGINAVRAIYETARAAGNAPLALSAQRTLQGWVELKAKITGELDQRPQVVVNLQQTAEWIKVQTVVLGFVNERLGASDRDELSRRLRVLDGPQG